jgi:magnesium-transporting ATPase (P-type)
LPSWIRIRIRNLNANPDPDPATQINPDPWGYGSETLGTGTTGDPAAALNTADMQNIAFMGTMVCSGRATGLVVATGERTQFGQVFRMMSEEESPPTPLQVSFPRFAT